MQEQAARQEQPIRILFVDDEPSIILTMPAILRREGYEVTAVGTVNEALAQITSAHFDVLISDLNIGHPGDGFTVVSAMRRTQPACITLILTGYPGFDSALEAIRSQVDDYLIKPAPVPTLINLIEKKLRNPRPGMAPATMRIAELLRENVFEITQRLLTGVKADPGLGAMVLTDEERINDTPRMIEELAAILESPDSEPVAKEFIQSSKARGYKRHQQGYVLPLLVVHARLLEEAVYEVIHENLLSLNLSYLMFDMKRLHSTLSIQLEFAQRAFLDAEGRINRRAE